MDLRHLTPLNAPVGAFATAYLDVSHDSENAEHEGQLRWSEQRSALEEQGADAETLQALDAAVRDARPAVGRAGRVLVARAGTLLLDRDLPEPPDPPRATWSPLPDLLPLLLDGPEPTTVVVARVDKNGGEILLADPADSESNPEPVQRVEGERYPTQGARRRVEAPEDAAHGGEHLAEQRVCARRADRPPGVAVRGTRPGPRR